MNNMNHSIKTVGIAGAGTMGAGIAQVCAAAGYRVFLYDINPEMLEHAKISIEKSLKRMLDSGKTDESKVLNTMENLHYINHTDELKADLILEAVVEKPEVKIDLFNKLAESASDSCIFATNTSSIPVTLIAAGLKDPGRLVGIHFFNPAQIMKLVEVIKGAHTNEDVVKSAVSFVQSLGKVPVVAADSPGFIVNRVARLYYVESLKILEENVAGFETIDRIMESSGFKMGPFRLMDLIGVDTNYSVTESQYNLFGHEARFRPSRIQKQKVDAGLHGKKSGAGFYNY